MKFSFSFFNSFNTINMGGQTLVYINALLHPLIPSWRKKRHLSTLLFNFGCSDQQLVTVTTRWQEWRALCQLNAHVSGSRCTCASCWLIPLMAGIMQGHRVTGVQSRARSGWVFSFSPFSSCFRVPASTTDWDLIIGEGKRYDYKQFMMATILELWRAFRHYVSLESLESQDIQNNYIIFPLV